VTTTAESAIPTVLIRKLLQLARTLEQILEFDIIYQGLGLHVLGSSLRRDRSKDASAGDEKIGPHDSSREDV
jgi:hypothetical protein